MSEDSQNNQNPSKKDETKSQKGGKCQILEILQHSCEIKNDKDRSPEVHCFPIPRILKVCQNRPAVEITRITSFDHSTGDTILPSKNAELPEGKPWWSVTKTPIKTD